jgi:hypothetical protein
MEGIGEGLIRTYGRWIGRSNGQNKWVMSFLVRDTDILVKNLMVTILVDSGQTVWGPRLPGLLRDISRDKEASS